VRDSASQLIESLAGSAAKGRQAAVEGAQSMSGPVRDAATKAVSAASSAVSSLASSVGRTGRAGAKPSSKKTTGSAKSAKANLDLSRAPGKKHRKAPPSVHGAKHSDEQIPKMKTAAAARQRRKTYA
jgi:hypothetical protein